MNFRRTNLNLFRKMDKSNKQQKALDAFNKSHNCAQAVLLAFAKDVDLPELSCIKIASGFGGGIALSGATCGAITGGIMALGLHGTGQGDSKIQTYDKSKLLIRDFKAKFGYLTCGDLTLPRECSDDKRFCDKFVVEATGLVEKLIKGE